MSKHKILIIDPIHEDALCELEKDFEVEYLPASTRQDILDKVSNVAIIIVRSGHKIDEELVNKAKKLRLVARAGTGIDNIDTDTLDKRKICFFSLPKVNSTAVAELAVAFIFTLSRNIPTISSRLKNNFWEKEKCYGAQVLGKTLGIMGYGSIGKKIAQLANGIGMKIIASVGMITQEKIDNATSQNITLVDNNEILQRSDYICVCVPLCRETTNMITMTELEMMKPNSYLINVSRGGVVNEADLATALTKRIIKGAATDVYEKEKEYSPLFNLDNIICTPHIGAMTVETQEEIGKLLYNGINDWKKSHG